MPVTVIHLLGLLAVDVISIDPDLIVVSQREEGLIASPRVSGEIGALFTQGFPKCVCIFLTTLDAWSTTIAPFMWKQQQKK